MPDAPIVTATLNPTIDRSYRVDHLEPEVKLRCRDELASPGGGGINVARVAHRLGTEVEALWSRGGPRGERLSALLDEEGVVHRGIGIPSEIRETVQVYDEREEALYRFVAPGPELGEDDLRRWEGAVGERASGDGLLVLSGSLPPGLPDDSYARLVRAAPPGCRVVVDSSGPALCEAVRARPFLIKPNRRELEDLAGRELERDQDLVDAARDLIALGVERVMVSLGSGGAIVIDSDEHRFVRTPSVPERSKAGAGDSTVAGLVAALARGEDLTTALRYGIAAGAAAVTTPGTELCTAAAVERLCDEAQVERS